MQNVLASYKKRKKNGGFTLVELIIVIAIMAALVAILAPQYIKYVDKSRKTADESTADSILSACRVAATEEGVTKGFKVIWDGETLTLKDDNLKDDNSGNTVEKSLEEALSLDIDDSDHKAELKAKADPDSKTYEVDSDGSGKVTVNSDNKGWWTDPSTDTDDTEDTDDTDE